MAITSTEKKRRFILFSLLGLAAAVIGVAAVWLLMPEIVQAAVTFGEIGENVAENAKGVAKGVTLAGYASGAGMGVWGCVDMYKASYSTIPFIFV